MFRRGDGKGGLRPVFICQVGHRKSVQVTCTAKEAVYRCEVIEPHDRHRVGEHTVLHSQVGNGYSCYAVERWLLVDRQQGSTPGWTDSRP